MQELHVYLIVMLPNLYQEDIAELFFVCVQSLLPEALNYWI